MEFRPCIDIHNGKVKQIVGGSLKDTGDDLKENFVSDRDAVYYAELYKKAGLKGGHVILLNAKESEAYWSTKDQALQALRHFPGGLQIGGGITPENAKEFLEAGASHVIVTSYVFRDGRILFDRLTELSKMVGKEHLVLDMSCKRTENGYRVTTDRWQKMTEESVDVDFLEKLEKYCDEFLIHAVDVEGKSEGIEEKLIKLLADYDRRPVTYAGGIRDVEDIQKIRMLGKGRIHFTVGSALDIFGGKLAWNDVLRLNSSN